MFRRWKYTDNCTTRTCKITGKRQVLDYKLDWFNSTGTLGDEIMEEKNDMSEYDKLSKEAQLADKVWRYIICSGKFDDCIASELHERFIIPIFGKDVDDEIRDYYMNAKL